MSEAALEPVGDGTSADATGRDFPLPEAAASGSPPGDPATGAIAERSGVGDARGHAEAPPGGRALISLPPEMPRKRFPGFQPSHGLVAAGVAVLMGSGFIAGTAFVTGRQPATEVARVVSQAETQMDVLHRVQGEVRSLRASLDGLRSAAETSRQDDTIRGLKKSVDLLKQDLEGVKAASTGAVSQLSAKLDKLDRDPTPKLAEIAARLDKLDREPAAKLSEISSRVERVERQVASSEVTGSITPPVPLPVARAAAVPSPTPPVVVASSTIPAPSSKSEGARLEVARAETARAEIGKPETGKPETGKPEASAKPDQAAKPAIVEGWMLRDVYGGVALVEGRAGGLREVAPGEYVPGVGEIRSIERRGRSWVVVTSRGIIQADNRW